MGDLADGRLQQLATGIPSILLDVHAASTNRTYNYMFQRWKTWASTFTEVSVLPADPFYVALFAIHTAKLSGSAASVKIVVPAINWGHRLAGMFFDAQNIFLKDTVSGLQRQLAKPRMPKEVLEIKHIKTILNDLQYGDVMDLRVGSMIMLAFFGFLRFNELINIKRSDITFAGSHMKVYIRRSKTDQLRQGDAVLISVLNNGYCPVSLLNIYLIMAKISEVSDCYIFRRIIGTGKDAQLISRNIPMTYSRTREIVLKKFQSIGLITAKFGLHSLRAGGATEAARHGIPDRLFQRHGRWSSELCKNMYVKDDIAAMLSVSKNLGL